MARTTWTKHSFSAGELSPSICQARADVTEGVLKCHNVVPLKSGSLIRRPKAIHYEDCKLPAGATRVIPFNLTHGIYVALVFGDKELSVISLGDAKTKRWTPEPFKSVFTTRYTAEETLELDYAINGVMMVLTHKDHPPYQLIYTGTGYAFSQMNFLPPPWLADGDEDGSFADVKLKAEKYERITRLKVSREKGDFTKERHVGRYIRLACLPAKRRDNQEYAENSYICAGEKVYQSVNAGMSGGAWVKDDKHTYIKDYQVNWKSVSTSGVMKPYFVWGEITGIESNHSIIVDLAENQVFTVDSPVVGWGLSAWSPTGGYPPHVTFYQNRLVFSGGKDDELSVHLSSFNNFYNFSPFGEYGVIDPKRGLAVAISDFSVSGIKWITPFGGGLLVGCDSALWLLSINNTQGFNVDFRRISGSGVYSCPPVSVGDCLFYVCGAGRRIKAIYGSIETGFRFIETSQFANHLFKYQIKELVYQEEPHSIVWVILHNRENGDVYMHGCCFISGGDDSYYAWHTHSISGVNDVISATSFPYVDAGETSVWLITKSKDRMLSKLDEFTLSGGQT